MVSGGPLSDDNDGVSEVISVVLMVAVTVILSAMVGSVLLNVVSDIDTNPMAGSTVEFETENDEVKVVYTTAESNDITLNVTVSNTSFGGSFSQTRTLQEVGDSETFTGLADGTRYEVKVVAERGEKRAVILIKDGLV